MTVLARVEGLVATLRPPRPLGLKSLRDIVDVVVVVVVVVAACSDVTGCAVALTRINVLAHIKTLGENFVTVVFIVTSSFFY